MNNAVEILEGGGRWRARDVRCWAGRWEQLCREIPLFRTEDFKADRDSTSNPYMKAVIRVPRTHFEQPVPVGVVSNTYKLAQHSEVAERCFEGIRQAGVATNELRCELDMTELGEWMNLRIYFPDRYSHSDRDGQKLGLRLECFNSVDGSSRLVLLLGWLRFVCANGLVIGETKAELKDIHNIHMDLEKIPGIVSKGLGFVEKDKAQLVAWERTKVTESQLSPWADNLLADRWGVKAACRVFYICLSGHDVEISDPFASGNVTTKPVTRLQSVPGARVPVQNLYDVSQSLSWVASHRGNPDERVEWQSQIPELLGRLATISV